MQKSIKDNFNRHLVQGSWAHVTEPKEIHMQTGTGKMPVKKSYVCAVVRLADILVLFLLLFPGHNKQAILPSGLFRLFILLFMMKKK